MATKKSVIEQLGFTSGTIDVDTENPGHSALKHHYLKQAQRFGENGVDKIYFSGEFPSVYFKSVSDFTVETLQNVFVLQRKIWNQGKVPFLFVESPTEIRVYNCYDTPKRDYTESNEISLRLAEARTNIIGDLEQLRAVFGKVSIETGGFWEKAEYNRRIQHKTRVDQALINNLRLTRRRLLTKQLSVETIHDLLLRSLFILYLQDRGATDAGFYSQYLEGANSYYDILENKEATYKLFEKLETSFNGNLSPIGDNERVLVTSNHLAEIKNCFWSDIHNPSQRRLFDWKIFDFGIISIQVISEIYEDFLSTQNTDEHISQRGAYYTPHVLAEFILNDLLPYPSDNQHNYNIKILDPTCGSGIFLVDSLNRLLDRWEYAHPKKQLTFSTIKSIVLNNIYGIEIELEAIKVAAFSIYLAMLDRLNPKTLWQNNAFPYLIHFPGALDLNKQGHNLFFMSSLAPGPFEDQSYDLIVGNPPFSTKVTEETKSYLAKYHFATETVLAFLHRASTLCPTGKISLIAPSKILFNKGVNYQGFRHFLFNKNYVEKIYNFSALRRVSKKSGGRNLFASAIAPVCILIYSKDAPQKATERIVYYAPTTVTKNRSVDGIVIDATDVQYLPRAEAKKTDTNIWKIAMWGTERDFRFLQRLGKYTSLRENLSKRGWNDNMGVGLETSQPTDVIDYDIKTMPHIDANRITRYGNSLRDTTNLDRHEFYRTGRKKAYIGPHILIKEGQENKRFCASFLAFDCSFTKTVYGIHSKDENALKVLVAYLNSSLAFYLLFLTSSTWGIERERVKPNEILDLPDLCFVLSQEFQDELVQLVDQIAKEKKVFSLDNGASIKQLEHSIDNIFWKGLGFSPVERILVDDLLNYRLDAFQEGQKSEAFRPCDYFHMQSYSRQLCLTLNQFLPPDSGLYTCASHFDIRGRDPLQVIALHLTENKPDRIVDIFPSEDVTSILTDIDSYTYSSHSSSIYYRRFIRYWNDNTVYIIKPNEKRFWSDSIAMNDADEIALELMTNEF